MTNHPTCFVATYNVIWCHISNVPNKTTSQPSNKIYIFFLGNINDCSVINERVTVFKNSAFTLLTRNSTAMALWVNSPNALWINYLRLTNYCLLKSLKKLNWYLSDKSKKGRCHLQKGVSMLLVGPALGFQTSWVSVAPLQIESRYNLFIFLEMNNHNLPLKKTFQILLFHLEYKYFWSQTGHFYYFWWYSTTYLFNHETLIVSSTPCELQSALLLQMEIYFYT